MFVTTATELPRIMACNGSHLMQPSFPNIDADRTLRDEGIAAHWAACGVFNNKFTLDFLDKTPTKAPNGVYISSDMIENISIYLSALDCGEMEIETSFGTDAFRINARADHVCHRPTAANGGILYIDDFKYGWSIVEPEENWTLIAHAIGYCIFNQVAPQTIKLTIHQPRPYHPESKTRTWSITYDQLMSYYNEIVTTLTELSDVLQTSPHCRRCPALATCPAAREAGYNAIDASALAFDEQIADEALSHELQLLEHASTVIENRLDALKNLAKYRITHGAVIDQYAVQTSYGHTKWKPEVTPEILKALTGQVLTKPGLITPAEAKRRGVNEAIVESLTSRPLIGSKLVRIDAHKNAEKLLK